MSIALLFSRGLHKRPGGWSPKQLATLSLWLDADDATTITTSTGVSQWDDKSANGYNVTQATGANQPSWIKGAQNGRAVVRFDGTNGVMNGTDVLDLLTGGISIVAAFKNNANSTVLSKTSGNVDANGEWAINSSGSDIYLGATLVQTRGTLLNATKVLSWVVDRSAGSTTWVNGTQTDTDTTTPFPNTTSYNTATSIVLGGRSGVTTGRLNGDLFEIVVSMSTLSTGDREYLEGYLAHKWGLAGNLPAGHPYLNAAP